MKHFIAGIFCAFSVLFTQSTFAAPFHYTFSGTISYIEVDGMYLSDIDFDNDYMTPEDTFTVGEVIEYTFLVDFDLAGFCAGPLGTSYSDTCTGVEIPDGELANYFFTDLVSATKLAPPTEEGTTFNYGLSLANLGSLVADSAVFIVSPYGISVDNWVAEGETTAGTLLIGTDAWAAANGNSPYGRINSTLILKSITPVIVEEVVECNKHHHEKHSKHHEHKKNHDDKKHSHCIKNDEHNSHGRDKHHEHKKSHNDKKHKHCIKNDKHNSHDRDKHHGHKKSHDDKKHKHCIKNDEHNSHDRDKDHERKKSHADKHNEKKKEGHSD